MEIPDWVEEDTNGVVPSARDDPNVRTERLLQTLDCVPQIIWSSSVDGRERYYNRRWYEFTGIPHRKNDDETASWLELVHPEDREKVLAARRESVLTGRYEVEYRLRHHSGKYSWFLTQGEPTRDASGEIIYWHGTCVDITERVLAEKALQWAAVHDPLTNLPNRTLFQDWLDTALNRAAKSNTRLGLLLLDLDDFKQINDTLGHEAGDQLLRTFGERLQSVVGEGGLVARLGGDEFAMILNNVADADQVISVADRLLARLREPHVYDGRILDCRATIGASIFPEHGNNRNALLRHADIALYRAKSGGRGHVMLFRPEMRAAHQDRLSMLAVARRALEEQRIVPFYQPKIDLQSGKIAGFEALLRWEDGRLGTQLPSTIAAAFEDLDLAAAVSNRMIDTVISDARRWLDEDVSFGHVAINAAVAEFRTGDFAERLLERLAITGVPTSCLQIEVTETVFLGRGAEYVEQALHRLNAAGVKIALDDFGTGYASLSHLKQFPVDIIKIDQSFVRDLEIDPEDAAIVRAVINLGQSLDIRIVAEGVETEGQHQFLISHGCDYGQGYLYGKAQGADQVPCQLGARLKRWA